MRLMFRLFLVALGVVVPITTAQLGAAGYPRFHIPHYHGNMSRGGYNRGPQMHVVTKAQDFDFTATEDIKVRVPNPPLQFDEKGRAKKYSSEELKQLKGDDPSDQKLPGYKSDISNLKEGSIVQVFLGKPRTKSSLTTTGTAGSKGKDSDGDDGKHEWVYAGAIQGKITKLLAGSTTTFTVQVTHQEMAMGRGTGNNNNNTKNAPHTVVDPTKVRPMTIVVLVEGNGPAGGAKPKGKK